MGAEPLNPYQANLPSIDVTEGDWPPEVKVKLFSAFSVGLATFLGSMFAGSILMGINYRRLGRPGEGLAMIVGGLLATSFMIGCGAFLLPDVIPSLIYTLVQVGVAISVFRILQTGLVSSHLRAGGRLASAWWTVPVAFLAVIPILAIAFGIEGVRQLSYGTRIEIGRDEVYISGSATEADGRWLADKLREAEWLEGKGAGALLHRSRKQCTGSLFVGNDYISDQETIQFLNDFGKVLADGRLGHPLEMRIVDESNSLREKVLIP